MRRDGTARENQFYNNSDLHLDVSRSIKGDPMQRRSLSRDLSIGVGRRWGEADTEIFRSISRLVC